MLVDLLCKWFMSTVLTMNVIFKVVTQFFINKMYIVKQDITYSFSRHKKNKRSDNIFFSFLYQILSEFKYFH